MNYVQLVHGWEECRAVVNNVLKPRVTQNERNFSITSVEQLLRLQDGPRSMMFVRFVGS
jgi:hypothetical protein